MLPAGWPVLQVVTTVLSGVLTFFRSIHTSSFGPFLLGNAAGVNDGNIGFVHVCLDVIVANRKAGVRFAAER